MRKTVSRLFLAVVVPLSLPSCTSTKLTATWSTESYAGRPIASILVIGVSQNPTARHLYEDTFVTKLASDNVKAVVSYRQLPSDAPPDRAAIEEAVKTTGVQAVLITHLIDVEDETHYHPPTRSSLPSPYYRGMYSYYSRAFDEVHTPGYYTTHKVYKLETNMYDGSTAELIWSAQTETVDPQNVERDIEGLVNVLIDDLRKKKLL